MNIWKLQGLNRLALARSQTSKTLQGAVRGIRERTMHHGALTDKGLGFAGWLAMSLRLP